MASKSKSNKPADGTRRRSAPSVTEFLAKISSGNKAQGPTKGLLGDITAADLAAAGRLEGTSTTDPGTGEELAEVKGRVEVDVTSAEGDGDGRRADRVEMCERVEVRGFFGGEIHQNLVRDASLHGVFVETATLLEVGDPVFLSFPLDNGSKLKVSGRVRWVTPFGSLKDARPGMGIELENVAADAREALSSLLHRRASARSS